MADSSPARQFLGRALMGLGLILLPVGLWLGATSGGPGAMTVELTLLGAGVACFLLGRALSGGGR
jgi:hypothetical protein